MLYEVITFDRAAHALARDAREVRDLRDREPALGRGRNDRRGQRVLAGAAA